MTFETKTIFRTSMQEDCELNRAFLIVNEVINHFKEKGITEMYDNIHGNVIDLESLNITLGTLDSLTNELTCDII